MCGPILYGAVVVALICTLPVPSFAQAHEGLRLPAFASPGLANPIQSQPRNRDKDSLTNGAIIGAVVLGTWCLIVCGQGLDNSGQLAGAVAVNAGLGALIGASIDARYARSRQVVFRWRF